MKRIIILILAAVILLAGCGGGEPPEREKLTYNKDTLTEDLCRFLDSAVPEDIVTVNVEIKRTDSDKLEIQKVLEDDYFIPAELAERIKEAVATGDYSKIENEVKRYYKNTHNRYGAPKYEDNIEVARAEYVGEYNERLSRARVNYYDDIVDSLPFGEDDFVSNGNNIFLVERCTTTAQVLCELSQHERTERITGWISEPPEIPEKLNGGVTRMILQDGLQVSLTTDKDIYKYGNTVRYRATLLNTGYTPVRIPIIDKDSLYPSVEFGFYEDGVLREDISSGYGFLNTDEVLTRDSAFSADEPASDELILEAGKSATFYLATSPHQSCAYGKDAVSTDSEWSIKISFTYEIDGREGQCEYEVPVAHEEE